MIKVKGESEMCCNEVHCMCNMDGHEAVHGTFALHLIY
jgi:hypothetical protein